MTYLWWLLILALWYAHQARASPVSLLGTRSHIGDLEAASVFDRRARMCEELIACSQVALVPLCRFLCLLLLLAFTKTWDPRSHVGHADVCLLGPLMSLDDRLYRKDGKKHDKS